MTKSAPAWEMTWCGNRVFPLNRGALRLLGRSRRSNPPGSPAMLPHPSGARSNPVPASPPTRKSQLKATKKRSQPSQRIDAESRRLMSEQLQRGRWLVSEISQPGDLPKDRSPDFYLIYRTLGWFDTLAMYHQRRLVPR